MQNSTVRKEGLETPETFGEMNLDRDHSGGTCSNERSSVSEMKLYTGNQEEARTH